MVYNSQRYEGFRNFYPFLLIFDKTLNISVSFLSICMVFSCIWRGNQGVQKTGPKRPVFFRSLIFKYERPRLQSGLFSGPVWSSSGLFPVLRPDFQTLGGTTGTAKCNRLKPDVFEALQLLKCAYHNGHIAADKEAHRHVLSSDIVESDNELPDLVL